MRPLIAIPVYNEERYVEAVLERVQQFASDILVVDDGSTDRTPELVAAAARNSGGQIRSIRREGNVGYGRSLRDAFAFAAEHGFDWVVTLDCDEQHEPASIPRFLHEAERDELDIISGSRYSHEPEAEGDAPPPDRRHINLLITREINERLGLSLTDSFCGFKAHRTSAMRRLRLDEDGYAFPMQFWVEAVAAGLRIGEIPVKLIYNDPSRSFGGVLDDAERRLAYYRRVLHCAIDRRADQLPASAARGVTADCP